jgi:NAD-dependent dihydropyrimidine dehydrogenase PreA subunit
VPYVIAEPCVDELDLSCIAVCPVDCIHFEEGVDRKAFINPDDCIDCGACEIECPTNAIFPAETVPTKWTEHAEINATWFADREAARAALEQVLRS